MDAADVGGAWILETPDADACAVDVPPVTPPAVEPEETLTNVVPYVAGAGIIALIVGYVLGSSNKKRG